MVQVYLEEQINLDLRSEVAGKVHKPKYIECWEKVIRAPTLALKFLKEGFKVCFEKNFEPVLIILENNMSARKEQDFVELFISRMR